jgi:hypothetical protein
VIYIAEIEVEFQADNEDEANEWVRGRATEWFDREEVSAIACEVVREGELVE